MLLFGGVFGVIALGVWIFCVFDVISTPADRLRVLPKWLWVTAVILLFDLGSILWLVAGRRWSAGGNLLGGAPSTRSTGRPSNPDDDEDFLAALSARAAEQRRERESGTDDGPS